VVSIPSRPDDDDAIPEPSDEVAPAAVAPLVPKGKPKAAKPSVPRGRSKVHQLLNSKRLVFVSLDLETGGESCGIIQLSAEIVRVELKRGGKSAAKDTLSVLTRGWGALRGDAEFNEYVNPGDDAEWNMAGAVHGLSESHPSIRSARDINVVWKAFAAFIEKNLSDDEEGCVVAYHGAASDMKWLWRLTQRPDAVHSMPAKLKWFLDPLKLIKGFVGCKLNPKKSKLASLSLGCVWSYIKDGKTLEGAHDSLVDARAQTDILFHPHLVPYIDRSKSIVTMSEVFGKNQLRELLKEIEPTKPVHAPWFELRGDDNFTWNPPAPDQYLGASGGGVFGPSAKFKEAVRNTPDLAKLFLLFLPIAFWDQVCKWTTKFAYTDWVTETVGVDRDGARKKVCVSSRLWLETPHRNHVDYASNASFASAQYLLHRLGISKTSRAISYARHPTSVIALTRRLGSSR
jgi:hypothetical protein